MSREIKFRAWIPKELESEEYEVEYEMCYDLAFEDYEPINDLLNNQKNLMQYTGLKDKNGVEIYEGDIIMHGDNKKNLNEVVMNNGCWTLENKTFRYFVINMNIQNSHINSCEVIGNIYENPVLIGGSK